MSTRIEEGTGLGTFVASARIDKGQPGLLWEKGGHAERWPSSPVPKDSHTIHPPRRVWPDTTEEQLSTVDCRPGVRDKHGAHILWPSQSSCLPQ